MQKILITGSGGFTASHLIPFLKQINNLELVGIDQRPGGLIPEHELDLLDANAIDQFIKGIKPDKVIHLAAITKSDNFQDFYKINVFATINMLQSIINNGLMNTRILIISSSAVYGNSPAKLLSEDHNLRPINFYGNSKVAMEQAALQYYRNFGLKLNIVRPFNIIGSGQPLYFVVPAFAHQLNTIKYKHAEPVIKVGNISPSRDFIDIHDVIRAYWLILNNECAGEIFNIGSSKAVKIETMLLKLIDLLGIKVEIQQDEKRLRKHEIPEQIADISKIKKLGWEPIITFEETLTAMLRDMQQA
jgi:GDP-4-dehydro-6-deoxy-D-mannose reductase